MQEKTIQIVFRSCRMDELDEADRVLIAAACRATERSYAPYSHFRVGAAVRLADGSVAEGSNQENAAYPSGLCAERIALFQANSCHPTLPVTALAIAACNDEGTFTAHPVTPCGACRQVIAETTDRYNHPIRLLMFGTEEVYVVDDAKKLLPLTFQNS